MNSASPDEIETFVIVHDQDLLLACEEESRFSGIGNYRYLFVGPRAVSRLAGRGDVILARELPDNIEDRVNLLSFTGWYALARNRLAGARWVTLLEYDVELAPDFSQRTREQLRANDNVIGYVPFPLSHPMYLHATPWLIPALREAHDIDLPKLVRAYLDAGGADAWGATTNASLSADTLVKFVDWFLPAARIFEHDPIGAHVHERALPAFCFATGLRQVILPGLLKHRQERSHGIRARSWSEAGAQADQEGIEQD